MEPRGKPFDPAQGRHIHRRSVVTDCWMAENDRLVAIGELRDDKSMPSLTYSGKVVPAGGTMHDMQITLVLSKALVIESIRVDMRAVPGETCHEIEAAYEKVVGLSIAKGFSRKLREGLGGASGCAHLTTLLLQMAPTILQAQMSVEDTQEFDPERWHMLTNSCHIFRENGPGFARVEEFANQRRTALSGEAPKKSSDGEG